MEGDGKEVFVALYENNNFKSNEWIISIFNFEQNECIDLSVNGFALKVSSLKWSLPEGVKVILHSVADCGPGSTYELRNSGEESFLSNASFDNLAVSLHWDNE